MNNRQILPFERNRYYVGKMLTSADFEAEQTYVNNKRRFLNQMIFGPGIVCGLSVFSLDDLSVLVESGVAIDGLGREVVLESAAVHKLSAIRGFEQLTTDTASLCLCYREEEIQPVYAVHRQEGKEEYEYNHIGEGCELYLTDAGQRKKAYEMETEFLTQGTLFKDRDYRIEVRMPATVCKGHKVRLVMRVEKLSEEQSAFSYRGVLQTPVFTAADGAHQLTLSFEKLALHRGDSFVKEYWMKVQDTEAAETDVVLESGLTEAEMDGKRVETGSDFHLRIAITDGRPEELVARETGRLNLEMKNMGEAEEDIHLADLKLVKTQSAYLIEEVVEKNIKHYIPLPSQEETRKEYLEFFEQHTGHEPAVQPAAESRENSQTEKLGKTPQTATGTLEIALGDRAGKGGIYYSGEIMHGLGTGNVAVQLGYEYLEEDRAVGANTRNTVYGNQTLFRGANRSLPNVETAVKVLNDKGSFIAAVKLRAEVKYLVLGFRWTAVKYSTEEDAKTVRDYAGKSIEAHTPTVVLGTRESCLFDVRFTNMQSCSLAYELTESGSGEISADGVYTAPGRAGVYEIHIYCVDMPVVDTYAYAIVKKKGPEAMENQEPEDAKP